MLKPLAMYTDEYNKQEAVLDELAQKSDVFKYLSDEMPEGSAARKIYEAYSKDLADRASDLSKNGLYAGNRRSFLDLKRRYSSEIGALEKAQKALETEQLLRRNISTKDDSILYANDNLNIDSFLNGKNPNLYGISGNELYARGAQAGKAASARMYSANDEGSTLGGYYRKWVERVGVSPDSIAQFMNSEAVRQEVDSILKERGASGNLTGANLERARQAILNGIYNGIVYQESVKPVRDEGRMSAAAAEQYALQREQIAKSAAMQGLTWDENAKKWKFNLEDNVDYQKRRALAAEPGNSGSYRGASWGMNNQDAVMIGAETGTIYTTDPEATLGTVLEHPNARGLDNAQYGALSQNQYIRNIIGNGDLSNYTIQVIPKDEDNDIMEDIIYLVPRKSSHSSTGSIGTGGGSSSADSVGADDGDNDIPGM